MTGRPRATPLDQIEKRGQVDRSRHFAPTARIAGVPSNVAADVPVEVVGFSPRAIDQFGRALLAGFPVALTLTFMTPALPDDIEILSRPVTYVTYEFRATDGKSHTAEIHFDANGEIKSDSIKIQDPTNANCAACHGEVHTSEEPLTINAADLDYPQTATTGQVIAAQKISESGVNLSGKGDLDRSWDIHAERQLKCTDCHYALNNPAHADEAQKAEPDHLVYDPRVLDISEYLQKPDHNFALGQSAQFNVAPELKGTMRRCDSCHDANVGHADWLPYLT